MPLFVKTRGVWKPSYFASVKAPSIPPEGEASELVWKHAYRAYAAVERKMQGPVLAFSLADRYVVFAVPDRASLTYQLNVRVKKTNGAVFLARYEPVILNGEELPAFYWRDGALNAPTDSAQLSSEITTVLQWRPVFQQLPGSGGQRGFYSGLETSGGDRDTHADPTAWHECVSFTTPGENILEVTSPGFCDVVIVGGGGAGGVAWNGNGGGGGGGQVLYIKDHWLNAGSHEVWVGSGGRGGYHHTVQGQLPDPTDPMRADSTSGEASSFSGYTALGGGAGGAGYGTYFALTAPQPGRAGGSGGGAGSRTANQTRPGGAALPSPANSKEDHAQFVSFGEPGGTSPDISDPQNPPHSAAGAIGGSAQAPTGSAGAPTDGVSFNEETDMLLPGVGFSDLKFGAGGAGGVEQAVSPPTPTDGINAPATLGGGGGGGSGKGSAQDFVKSGDGGSGRVYIVYKKEAGSGVSEEGGGLIDAPGGGLTELVPSGIGLGGTKTTILDNSWDLHTFDSPGTYTFTVTQPGVFDILVLGGGGGGGPTLERWEVRYIVDRGSGGGAGAAVIIRGMWLDLGDYQVQVGAGGGGFLVSLPTSPHPTSGSVSSFATDRIVCLGGGHGGAAGVSPPLESLPDLKPASGGCGGGRALIFAEEERRLPYPNDPTRFYTLRPYVVVGTYPPGGANYPQYGTSGFDHVFAGSNPGSGSAGGSSLVGLPSEFLELSWLSYIMSENPGMGMGGASSAHALPTPFGAGGNSVVRNADSGTATPGGDGLVVIARKVDS